MINTTTYYEGDRHPRGLFRLLYNPAPDEDCESCFIAISSVDQIFFFDPTFLEQTCDFFDKEIKEQQVIDYFLDCYEKNLFFESVTEMVAARKS